MSDITASDLIEILADYQPNDPVRIVQYGGRRYWWSRIRRQMAPTRPVGVVFGDGVEVCVG